MTAHWEFPDPAHVEGDEARRKAFNHAAEQYRDAFNYS